MEEAKTLLLSLEFDTDEGLKRAANFRSAIDADKEALAELNKVIKKNGEANEQQLVDREKLEQNIKKNVKARGEEIKKIDDYLKATKNSIDANGKYNGSINNLRGNLAFLTTQWNNLTKEERENAQVGGVLQKEVKRLSDELKNLEGSVGDNRRSVGGYLDAIRQAPGVMGKMKAGVTGISTALSASPLGLLTTLLPAIIGFFNSSGEGADFFAKAMGGINAVLQVGMKYLVQFGGYLVDAGEKAVTAFKSPKKILSDLVEFMKTNLINRFKAFAVILEGIKTMDFRKVTDGVIQMGTGVTDATTKIQKFGQAASNGFNQIGKDITAAANAGAALEDRLDKLAERERKLAVEASNTRKEINALSIQARNRTLSEAERLKILDKADKLQLSLNDKQLKLERDRLDLIKEQNKISQEDSDVQDQRLTEQLTKINELEEAGQNIREKFQVRKDALLDKRKEAEVKAFEENKKRIQQEFENLKAVVDKNIDLYEKQLGYERDREAERDKALNTDIERLEKQRKKRDADAEYEKKREKDIVDYKKNIRLGEYNALVTLAAATSGVINAVADETGGLAEFQKAIALFQIALDQAQAVGKLTASATEVAAAVAAASGPAGVITGPLAYAAYYGTQIATIAKGFLEAKKLVSGPTPKLQHYDGFGYTGDGDPHHESTALGAKPYTYHKKELIASDAALSNPLGAMAGNILMAIMGKEARFNAPSNFNGGVFSNNISRGAIANNAPQLIDYNKLAKAMAAQPAPVVSVSRLNQATLEKETRKKQVTLGK